MQEHPRAHEWIVPNRRGNLQDGAGDVHNWSACSHWVIERVPLCENLGCATRCYAGFCIGPLKGYRMRTFRRVLKRTKLLLEKKLGTG